MNYSTYFTLWSLMLTFCRSDRVYENKEMDKTFTTQCDKAGYTQPRRFHTHTCAYPSDASIGKGALFPAYEVALRR